MSPLPGSLSRVRSQCGGRDGVVAEICHLFKSLLSLCRVNAVEVGVWDGSWSAAWFLGLEERLPVGGML